MEFIVVRRRHQRRYRLQAAVAGSVGLVLVVAMLAGSNSSSSNKVAGRSVLESSNGQISEFEELLLAKKHGQSLSVHKPRHLATMTSLEIEPFSFIVGHQPRLRQQQGENSEVGRSGNGDGSSTGSDADLDVEDNANADSPGNLDSDFSDVKKRAAQDILKHLTSAKAARAEARREFEHEAEFMHQPPPPIDSSHDPDSPPVYRFGKDPTQFRQ